MSNLPVHMLCKPQPQLGGEYTHRSQGVLVPLLPAPTVDLLTVAFSRVFYPCNHAVSTPFSFGFFHSAPSL